MDVLLACDLGTSSCKLTALNLAAPAGGSRILCVTSAAYPTRYGADGGAEQDPQDWLGAFAAAMRAITDKVGGRDLRGLVFTGQMSAALLVDAAATPLHPALIWSDQRAQAEAAEAAGRIDPESFYELTGNPLNATYTAPKLAWLARRAPELRFRARAFLQPKDWLIAKLTAAVAMDHSDASCTGLYDLRRSRWSERLFDLFGLPLGWAPALAEATSVAGTLTAEMAQATGLPAGLPVVRGGGDGPTTALGVGIGPGEAYLSAGTSAWISFLSDQPLVDAHRRLIAFRHVLPGLYAITGSTQNAGAALSWLSEILGLADAPARVHEAMSAVAPGAEGLLVLPYLQGERTPVWDSAASGALLGLRSHHTRAHIVRAFVEAICFQLRLILETFAACGLAAEELRVVGGLASDAATMNALAGITQTPLVRPRGHAHVTALGAGMVGALALGIVADPAACAGWAPGETVFAPAHPDATLERGYAAYKALYQALAPIRSMLD